MAGAGRYGERGATAMAPRVVSCAWMQRPGIVDAVREISGDGATGRSVVALARA